MRKLLIWGIIIPIVAFVLVVGVAYFFQEKLIFIPEKLTNEHQYEFGGNWKERTFDINGVQLNAIHFKVSNPEGIVIYFHGNAGSLESWGHVGLDFTRLNQDVLVFDYRGYGKSGGSINSERQLLADAQFIYDKIKSEYKEESITLYGRSLGSGIAAYIATENNPENLVLETPCTSLNRLGGEIYPKFITNLMKYKLPTYKFLPKIKCPVYLFHGTDDQLIGYHHSEELVASNPKVKLYTLEEGTHNNLPEFPEYHIALAEIFSK
ncbi:MAG: alpha/beta fold hydrolase [Flavobacteriales bacterium]|nr:alpha/beta fold hydrolase [Flavobacteriales bacterium]